eukprot:Clim_evm54s191 gene=Clim_evmTU54s191
MVRQVLVACDSFKGTLTAAQANHAIATGLKVAVGKLFADLRIDSVALSDGGEGFLSALASSLTLQIQELEVSHPVQGKRVRSVYGIGRDQLTGQRIAVLEMAQSAGLDLVGPNERHPLQLSTQGFGETIKAACEQMTAFEGGESLLLIGIGGSATNDAGLGALGALGLQIYGSNDSVPLTGPIKGKDLLSISRLALPKASPKGLLPGVRVRIASDVTNPFTGPKGAVAVFSEQKGATPHDKELLEQGMQNVEPMLSGLLGRPLSKKPGGGAAGGVGGGLISALESSQLLAGAQLVSEAVHLEERIRKSTLVITGEGQYDSQTADGKICSHVMSLCERHKVPVMIVCGNAQIPNDQTHQVPVLAMTSHFPLEECLSKPDQSLERMIAKQADLLTEILN